MRYLSLTLMCFCVALTISAGVVPDIGFQGGAQSATVGQNQPMSLHQFMQQHNTTPGDNRFTQNVAQRLSSTTVKGKRLVSTTACDCGTDDFNNQGYLQQITGDPYPLSGWLASVNTNTEGDYVIQGFYGDFVLPVTFDLSNYTAAIPTGQISVYQNSDTIWEEVKDDPPFEVIDTTITVEIVPEQMLLSGNYVDAVVGDVYDDGSVYFSDGFAIRIKYYIKQTYYESKSVITFKYTELYYTATIFRDTYLLAPNGIHKYTAKVKVANGSSYRGSDSASDGNDNLDSDYNNETNSTDRGSHLGKVKKPDKPIPPPKPISPTDPVHVDPYNPGFDPFNPGGNSGGGTGTNSTHGWESVTGYKIETYNYQHPVYLFQIEDSVWVYGLYSAGSSSMNYMLLHEDGTMDFPMQQVGYRNNYTTSASTPSVSDSSLTPGNHGNWTPTVITWGKTVLHPTMSCIYYNNQLYYSNDYVNGGEFFYNGGNVDVPEISTSVSSLDFGNVVVGAEPVTQTFTVTGTNLTGDMHLTVAQIGVNTFSINPTTISKSDASNGVTVTVTYMPATAGRDMGTITITGGGAESKTVSLSGIGIVPTITTSDQVLDFGDIVVGAEPVAQTFTVIGTDLTGPLTLTLTGGNFAIDKTSITADEAATGATVTVTCTATEAGAFSGQITIDGGGAESKTVTLTGNCLQPTITVSPTSINFDDVVIGAAPVTQTFTVTGTNLTGPLTLTLTGNNFAIDKTSITADEAATGATVTVTCSATESGAFSGQITISDGGAESNTVTLTGNCLQPTITVSPTSINFGDVLIGDTRTDTITVTCTNVIGNLTLRSTNHVFKVNNASQTTLPGSGGTVTVTYMPDSVCNNGGYIVITGAGVNDTVRLQGRCVQPIITTDTTSLDFGSVIVGDTAMQQSFTVIGTNLTGDLHLGVGQVLENGEFSISPTTINSADAANGVTVTVTCTATDSGSMRGNVAISGGGAETKYVSLKAEGVAPAITVSPSSLDFGNVLVGDTTIQKTFIVTGTNLTRDIFLSLAQTGVHGGFSIYPTTISKAAAASGATVTVTCSAIDAGSFSGQITASSKNAKSKTVSLSGTGVVPTITVSPSSLDFGTVVKGQTCSKTFTVTGTDLTGDLTLSSNYTRFTVTPATISSSDAANGVTVTVTYKPTAAANHRGQITVSGGGAESKTVTLKGTCIAPTITVSPSSLAFGTVVKGQTTSKTFVVTGTDLTGNLTLSSNSGYYTVSPATISPSDAANGVTVTVTYAPTAAGSHSGTIIISGGDATGKTVSLSGTCIAPTITVSPSSLNFGNVAYGSSKSMTITVAGTDLTGDLTLSSSSIRFTVTPTTISPSDAANGVTVTVTYKPTAESNHKGIITISGGGAESKTVSVKGTGVASSTLASPVNQMIDDLLHGRTDITIHDITDTIDQLLNSE